MSRAKHALDAVYEATTDDDRHRALYNYRTAVILDFMDVVYERLEPLCEVARDAGARETALGVMLARKEIQDYVDRYLDP